MTDAIIHQFGPAIAGNLRRFRTKPSPRGHLDEMVIRGSGKLMHSWRAVDDEGEVLEVLVQRRREGRSLQAGPPSANLV